MIITMNLQGAWLPEVFLQIIDRATHKDGNILDHVYIRDVPIAEWQFHHPYYTDHDAICLRTN